MHPRGYSIACLSIRLHTSCNSISGEMGMMRGWSTSHRACRNPAWIRAPGTEEQLYDEADLGWKETGILHITPSGDLASWRDGFVAKEWCWKFLVSVKRQHMRVDSTEEIESDRHDFSFRTIISPPFPSTFPAWSLPLLGPGSPSADGWFQTFVFSSAFGMMIPFAVHIFKAIMGATIAFLPQSMWNIIGVSPTRKFYISIDVHVFCFMIY